jgi:hypothetical protein
MLPLKEKEKEHGSPGFRGETCLIIRVRKGAFNDALLLFAAMKLNY